MARTIYLIDTENVMDRWIGSIELKSALDKIIIFWSRNSKTISMNVLQRFLKLYPADQIDFVECYTGPNSMDFHIVAKLGQLTARFPKTKFSIVSDDAGYDGVIQYLCDNDYHVERIHIPKKEEVEQSSSTAEKEKKGQPETTDNDELNANKQEEVTAEMAQALKMWGKTEDGIDILITENQEAEINKIINSFYRVCPSARRYHFELVKILKTTTYPSKSNAVLVYNAFNELHKQQTAKVATIYRAMKIHLLPELDRVILLQNFANASMQSGASPKSK